MHLRLLTEESVDATFTTDAKVCKDDERMRSCVSLAAGAEEKRILVYRKEICMKDKRKELLEGNMFLLMMKLSIPGIIGMLIISMYSFVDAAFVGRYVGEKAFGAVCVAYAFTLVNNGIAVLVGIGSASLLSRAVGRNDKKTIDAVMDNVFILTAFFSLIVMITGYIFAPAFLSLVGVTGKMHSLGVSYLRIIYLGSFFVNFAQAANMVIRAEGKMMKAMLIMALPSLLNIALDALFIINFKMGIEGAAIATVISQGVFALVTFVYFAFVSTDVRLRHFRLTGSIVKETLSIGVSAMLMQILALLQQSLMYATLKRYGGEEEVILMGAFFRYMMLSFIPLWGLSQAFQPFIGTNYGASLFVRVKKGTAFFYAFGVLLALVAWSILFLNPEGILSLFIKDNAALLAKGKPRSLLSFSVFPLVPFIILNITFFQAIGKAKEAGLLALSRQFFLFIPACLILPFFTGAYGVWLSLPLVDFIVFVLSLVLIVREFNGSLKEQSRA